MKTIFKKKRLKILATVTLWAAAMAGDVFRRFLIYERGLYGLHCKEAYASLLIEQGENIKYIQNQLGHSSPTVTWNVYTHLMKPVNQEAACKLEKTVFETNGSKTVAEMKRGATAITVTP